jgi:hypothetical protein
VPAVAVAPARFGSITWMNQGSLETIAAVVDEEPALDLAA